MPQQVKVQSATSWVKEFDEWRPLAGIVSRSADSQSSDAIALLRHDLAVKVQSDTFEEFVRVANVQKEKDRACAVYRCSVKDVGRFLASDWYRQ